MMMEDTHTRTPTWSPLERVGFRFVFSYYAMFGAASLLDTGPRPRALLAMLRDPLAGSIARVLFGIDPGDHSASVRIAIAQQIAALVSAAALAAVWSIFARRREYQRLLGWFKIALRYYVGGMMSIYGGVKLIDTQFPPIPLDQLSEPLGGFTPMGLLWAYMGYSSLYASFAGFGECLGAFLLFFRRTTTLGALILVAVLSNVALINYVYDVPVKQLSTNLLLASIFLAATDMRRLVDVFVRNADARPADLSFPLAAWQRRAQSVVRPLIIALATLGPLTASFFIRRNVIEKKSPLYGVYDVVRFERNGVEVPPLTSDSSQWRRITFARPGSVSIRLMSDSTVRPAVTVDTVQHRLRFSDASRSRENRELSYRPNGADALIIDGRFGADSISVALRRLDPRRTFRLLR